MESLEVLEAMAKMEDQEMQVEPDLPVKTELRVQRVTMAKTEPKANPDLPVLKVIRALPDLTDRLETKGLVERMVPTENLGTKVLMARMVNLVQKAHLVPTENLAALAKMLSIAPAPNATELNLYYLVFFCFHLCSLHKFIRQQYVHFCLKV